MTIDQSTFLNWFGLRPVPELENSEYTVLVDDMGLGLVFHRLKKPGQYMRRAVVCARGGEAPIAVILALVGDKALPPAARMFATDLGGWFRWSGTAWVVEGAFPIIESSASVATPLVEQTNLQPGFNQLGPGITLPVGFLQLGRRFRWSSTVGRTLGSRNTAQTQVAIGAGSTPVAIFTAPWTASAHEHYPFFEFWVSGPTRITSKGLAVPNGSSDTGWTADFTVANLLTTPCTLRIGINNTEGSVTTEHFALSDVLLEVTA